VELLLCRMYTTLRRSSSWVRVIGVTYGWKGQGIRVLISKKKKKGKRELPPSIMVTRKCNSLRESR